MTLKSPAVKQYFSSQITPFQFTHILYCVLTSLSQWTICTFPDCMLPGLNFTLENFRMLIVHSAETFCGMCIWFCNISLLVDSVVFLENINMILAFIINIISQPIEHLNISSAFIVGFIRKCTCSTVNVYTAIMINCLSFTQWVELVNI